jgi:succinate-semialdehyde dehydrogenase / glutarate-semialdehyde dehydrogenase
MQVRIATTNPATGDTTVRFAAHDAATIEARVAAAAAAFEEWRATPLPGRLRVIRRVGDLLDARRDTYAELMTLEMGKLLSAARDEAAKCALACRWYADNAERLLAHEPVEVEGERAYVAYQPLGVVLAVMPWNFPFWQVLRFAAPALAAGNVALLKHASSVPQCALAIEALFDEAGAPPGVFTTLLVGSETVAPLLADPRIAAATLTGSEGAGRSVAAAAGRELKKTVLELGGSDPFIVLPGADLDAAARVAVQARMINNGQSCIAAKRFIVHESIADAFTAKFVANVEALVVGDPRDPATHVGPLASRQQVEDIDAQVRQSVEAGARLLTGGRAMPGEGFYYAPTVLADVPPEAAAWHEELFGPVASVFRVPDADSAIALANGSRFGLGASVWTRDVAEAERVALALECGAVFVNAMVASDPRFPFGGVKASGYGRELGAWGLREFTNVKTVRIRPEAGP